MAAPRLSTRSRRPFVRRRDQRILALHPSAMRAVYEPREPNENCIVDGIGILCIDGPLESKAGWFFDDYECILQRYKDLIYSDDVRIVLLKIDSPGGDAAGLNEMVRAMIECRDDTGKLVVAFADEGAYSAAYAIACAADEIYLPEPGGLGSIGVISALVSTVRMNEKFGVDIELITSGDRKADGNPDAPITDEARAHVQRRVDQLAKIYWRLVSDARGMKVREVRNLEADTFYGYDAVEVGLADDVMSLDDVLRYLHESLRLTA